ncbi:peptidase S8/S53 domain-containing protein [Catenaria anguillulae PL171]|uniref:Peptidase S8/S53 domain-containing protein n=1 Tax=Catenaria anguillulae PL171 TaxID=765915 RepID=A0A1Y2I2R1_9FUNG|nr:peptidase S8/S53 domain-containing protein [Catenaria anguillulae PL171]
MRLHATHSFSAAGRARRPTPILLLLTLLSVLLATGHLIHAIADPDPQPQPDPASIPIDAANAQDDSEIDPVDSNNAAFGGQAALGAFTRNAVSSLLQLAAKGDNYIVELKPEVPVNDIMQHVSWVENRLNVDLGLGHLVHKFALPPAPADLAAEAGAASVTETAFYGYSGTLNPILVEALKALPIVRSVSKDDVASIVQTQQPTALMQRDAPWGLSRICRVRPPNYNDVNQRTFVYNFQRGLGTDVFVLDTGVRTSHRDFQGRASQPILQGFAQQGGDPNGHGTHVAGICCSRTYGVSKGPRVIGIQVLGAGGTGPWSNVIKGVEYAVQSRRQTKRPTVINISIVGNFNQALNNALVAATRNGVHVVVAAGNSNQDTCRTSPGSLGGRNSDVLVVGAVGQSDNMSGFSNWGACVDLSAPGEFIMSLGHWADDARKDMSGTSMASPHAAGAVSVVLSRHPNLTPAQAKKFMVDMAQPMVKNSKGSTNKLLYLNPRL